MLPVGIYGAEEDLTRGQGGAPLEATFVSILYTEGPRRVVGRLRDETSRDLLFRQPHALMWYARYIFLQSMHVATSCQVAHGRLGASGASQST